MANREYADVEKQDDLSISMITVKKLLSKMAPWKAAGPDGVQGFWLKNFTKLHERLSAQMQEIISSGRPPV